MDAGADIRLSIPARAECVPTCRQALAAFGRRQAIDAEIIADLKVALTEACTNVVRHAYADGKGVLEVHLQFADNAVVIEVTDAGRGFALTSLPAPPARPQEGGYGLSLIQSLTDDFAILTGPQGRGTGIRFCKWL